MVDKRSTPEYLERAINSLPKALKLKLAIMSLNGAKVRGWTSTGNRPMFTITMPRWGNWTDSANPGLDRTVEYAYNKWQERVAVAEKIIQAVSKQ